MPQPAESERRSFQYFREHAEEIAADVRRTGRPVLLTDAKEGEFVLQDAATYARMKADIEQLATMRAIQQGIDAAEAGQVMPSDQYFQGLKERIALRR